MKLNPFATPDFPTKDEVLDMLENVKHTPDGTELKAGSFNLLFTYGSLQKRGCMYKEHLDQHSVFIARAFTVREFYVQEYAPDKDNRLMIATSSDEDSMALRKHLNKGFYDGWAEPKGEVPCIIQGEIHAVDPDCMMELDKAWENTVGFDRTRVELTVPYRVHTNERLPAAELPGPYQIQKIWAWTYLGVPERWEGQEDLKRGTIMKSKDFGHFYILK